MDKVEVVLLRKHYEYIVPKLIHLCKIEDRNVLK